MMAQKKLQLYNEKKSGMVCSGFYFFTLWRSGHNGLKQKPANESIIL